MKRATVRAAGILAAASLFAGCARSVDGGQTLLEATEAASLLPGVASAQVESDSVNLSPFERVQHADIRLTLEPGWEVGDGAGLVRWALTTVRSISAPRIDYSAALWLSSPDGTLQANWPEAAETIGISDDWSGADSFDEHGFLLFMPEDIASVINSDAWPADPPPAPKGAFVPRGDVVSVPSS